MANSRYSATRPSASDRSNPAAEKLFPYCSFPEPQLKSRNPEIANLDYLRHSCVIEFDVVALRKNAQTYAG